MKTVFFILVVALLYVGCSKNDKPAPTTDLIKESAIKALNGDTTSNELLGNIINFKANNNSKYSRVVSDTIFANENDLFIDLLIENPYTFSNKYAVYDKHFNLLFLDQSLHGKIDKEVIKKDGLYFILITENFIANDSIRIKRANLYKVNANFVGLVYKNYYYIDANGITYTQKITFLNDESLKTEIYMNDKVIANDEYSFKNNRFSNRENKFETLINNIYKPDYLVGNVTDKGEFSTIEPEYNINKSDEWVIANSNESTESFPSVKYLNNRIHAKLTILKLPFKINTENVINIKLDNTLEGNYTVRYSNILTDREDKFIFQYYEYTSKGKKFLMLITIAKENYEMNKDELNLIAASFAIN